MSMFVRTHSAERTPALHVHGARRVEIHHEDLGSRLDGVLGVDRMGVESLGAAPDPDHHLTDQTGTDPAGDAAPSSDHRPSIGQKNGLLVTVTTVPALTRVPAGGLWLSTGEFSEPPKKPP